MTETWSNLAENQVVTAARRGFRTTFMEPTPEQILQWDFAPRWPTFLHRFLHWEVTQWLFLIAVFGIAGAAANDQFSWPALVGALAVVPFLVARWNLLMGWRVGLALALWAGLAWGGEPMGGIEAFALIGVGVLTVLVSLSYSREVGLWAWAAATVVVAILMGGGLEGVVPLAALFALLTDTIRSRRLAAIALDDQRELTGLERARRVGAEERSRIARELHDIVAHHMSMVAVRAETAPFRLDGLDEKVKAEFAEISQAARDSLNEIRGLLSVLRSDEAPRVPQPGLDQIDELVEATRQAGVEVSLTVRGEPRPLRPAVEISAFRILQECLANVSRHAAGESAEVWVVYGADSLDLMVANPAEKPAGAPGHGITGMEERAAAVGGSVDSRLRADGRWVVEATLPVEQ